MNLYFTIKKYQHKKFTLFLNFILIIVASFFSLSNTHAQQRATTYESKFYKGSIGYYEYLPPKYAANTSLPLLVFLHGTSEAGTNITSLLKSGMPPKIIADGKTAGGLDSFIVISPQSPRTYWYPEFVDEVVEMAKANYKVDISRIYVTGLSAGGSGTWNYAIAYPEKVAAIMPIAAVSVSSEVCLAKNVPVWSFQGSLDGLSATAWNTAYNKCNPPIPGKLTVVNGAGHSTALWGTAYQNLVLSPYKDSTGLTANATYKWLLGYRLGSTTPNTNLPPTVDAGKEIIAEYPVGSIQLKGTATDKDGVIKNYWWSQESGPDSLIFSDANVATPTVTGFGVGSYELLFTAIDNEGVSSSDILVITVKDTIPNLPPIVNAGEDISVQLPALNVQLSGTATDKDGTIKSYLWEQTGGINILGILDATLPQITLTGILSGTYTFKLTVTDNDGASSSDEIKITVSLLNSAPTVNAGKDIVAEYPVTSIQLTGTATDKDGTIKSYSWSQESGPTPLIFPSATDTKTTVSGFTKGQYIVVFTAVDDKGASSQDKLTITVKDTIANIPPSVNAGSDLTIELPVANVQLSGTVSDADGTIKSYAWKQMSGPNTLTWSGSTLPQAIISGLIAGTYEVQLTATDNEGASTTDNLTINVKSSNQAPIADAGKDVVAEYPTASIALKGTATDNDGTIKTYAWSQESGPNTLTLSSSVQSEISVSGFVAGKYVMVFSATDDKGSTSLDKMEILVKDTIPNQLPVAYAGKDVSVRLPITSLKLSGTYLDKDGTIKNFLWSQVSGPNNITLSNLTITSAAQITATGFIAGTYTFRLTITDNDGATDSDDVKITVTPANLLPHVYAGEDISAVLPAGNILLSGTATDDDGTISGYTWSQESGPNTITLSSTGLPQTFATGFIAGKYVFKFTAVDNEGASSSDNITIDVAKAGAEILYRINCGGTEVEDSALIWSSDLQLNPSPYLENPTGSLTTGSNTWNGVNGSDAPGNVFGNTRYSKSTAPMLWSFPVPNGKYTVKLYFSDAGNTNGARVFNIAAENNEILSNFDIHTTFGDIGGVKTFVIEVTDGNLNIAFSGVLDRPKIDAIEISTADPFDSSVVTDNDNNESSQLYFTHFPEPVSEEFNIEYRTSVTEEMQIELLNQAGFKVLTIFSGITNANEVNHLTVPTNKVKSGLYFLVIKSNSYFATEKILIQR